MGIRGFRRAGFRAVFICAIIGALSAASVDRASAACYERSQQVSSEAIDKFLANPSQILTDNPNGGQAMISTLRDLAASSPATLPAILALLGAAGISSGQVSAIGTALGQAAQACLKNDPTFAAQIQQLLAATGNQPAILAFAAVLGDRPIGAVGGGAGGGGGGASGGASGGPTNPLSSSTGSTAASFQAFTSSSTPTSTTNYFTVPGSAAGSTTTNTTINNAGTSVSP